MSRTELLRELERLRSEQKSDADAELSVYKVELNAQADELSRAKTELHATLERYAELYDFAPVAHMSLDRNGVIREVNLAGAEMMCRERQYLVGTPLLRFVTSRDRDLLMDHLRRCRDNVEGHVVTQLEVEPPGGAARAVQLTSSGCDHADGALFLTVVTDLTAMRMAEERLRESEKHAAHAERLASLGTMAAGIAHEIRNPLNSILMSAEYARDALHLDSETRETVVNIAAEARRCGEIVRGLLDFARKETAAPPPCELNHVLRCAAKVAAGENQAKVPEIHLRIAPGIPRVRIGAVEMEQIVLNLIRNAVQAARGRSVISLTTLAVPEGVRLEVSDNGPGIPPELLPRIFDPFCTTRRNQGGTGLGLSIVHTLVTQHGGHIGVSSQLNRGTTFTITLPVADPGER